MLKCVSLRRPVRIMGVERPDLRSLPNVWKKLRSVAEDIIDV